MLLPTLAGKPFTEVCLDREAVPWLAAREAAHGPAPRSPLLDPALCEAFVAELHTRLGVAWSYGGWMEDRTRIWRGSYLEVSGAFIHLGVDFHVPVGTPVATDLEARVMLVDDDGDQDGGWGTRIFLKPLDRLPGLPDVVLIHAHLQAARVEPGQYLAPGTLIADVGGPPHNGNWSPHLHVQAIRQDHLARIMLEGFSQLDGYGHPDHLEEEARLFPDPMPWLRLS